MKKKVVIYGLGKSFNNDFFLLEILPKLQDKYDVIGGCDRNTISNCKLKLINRSEALNKYDKIIITSNKFFAEIKRDLEKNYHINSEKIVSLDEEWTALMGNILEADLFRGKSGVEVGGPSVIFETIYSNIKRCDGVNFSNTTKWWINSGKGYYFKNKKLGDVIIEDAVHMESIKDNSYDFCISSNNLEHIANPLKAISEYQRIVKKRGLLLVVVPRKESNFDHNRQITTAEHIIEDYLNDISELDLTHLEEIIQLHDYDMDDGVVGVDDFYNRALNNYSNRCLHHHVFDEKLLIELFKYMDIKIINSGSMYYNYYILGEVSK